MILFNYNEFIKENEQSNIVYRGAPTPEFGKGNWKGVFVSTDLKSAQQYHENIYKYELSPDTNLLGDPPDEDPVEPDVTEESEKISKIVNDYLESDDPDAGWINEIADLWMFPPDGWIEYLRKLGYDGTTLGMDRFIFNTNKLKFITSV